MAQQAHIADAIVDQIVDRLRWGVPTTATYADTGNNTADYTTGRDRDVALATSMLPFVDVRMGSETAMPGKVGTYSAELQVHVDLYCRAFSGVAVSRSLERLRLLTQAVLLRPSFKGTAQTASLMDLNMGPVVHSIRASGADEVGVFQEGEVGIGHLRTTYAVRYSVPPLGILLPDVNPSAFTPSITNNGASNVGWSITAPASNGLNSDLTTFVWIVDDDDGAAVSASRVRDGQLENGAPATTWYGVQAKSSETVSGAFASLSAGSYKLHIAQIASGVLDSSGPVTLTFTKGA